MNDDKKVQMLGFYDVNSIAKDISIDRFDKGFPLFVIIGEVKMKVEDVIINGKNAKELYKEALNNPIEQIRSQRLSELDRLLAERAILACSSITKYNNTNEAEGAKNGISQDYPNWQLETKQHAESAYLFDKKLIEDSNILGYLVEKVNLKDLYPNGKIQDVLTKISENQLTGFVIEIQDKNGNKFREFFLNVNNVRGDIASLKYFSAINDGKRENFEIKTLLEKLLRKYNL